MKNILKNGAVSVPGVTYRVIQTAEKKGNATSWQINASLTLMRQNELTKRYNALPGAPHCPPFISIPHSNSQTPGHVVQNCKGLN